MKVTTEIRECTWVGDVPVKWQGHAYTEGRPMAEPMVSGMPANSVVKARRELEKALEEYADLCLKGQASLNRYMNLKKKKDNN